MDREPRPGVASGGRFLASLSAGRLSRGLCRALARDGRSLCEDGPQHRSRTDARGRMAAGAHPRRSDEPRLPGAIIFFLFAPAIALVGIAVSERVPRLGPALALAAILLQFLMFAELLAAVEMLLIDGPLWAVAPLAALAALPALIEVDATRCVPPPPWPRWRASASPLRRSSFRARAPSGRSASPSTISATPAPTRPIGRSPPSRRRSRPAFRQVAQGRAALQRPHAVDRGCAAFANPRRASEGRRKQPHGCRPAPPPRALARGRQQRRYPVPGGCQGAGAGASGCCASDPGQGRTGQGAPALHRPVL